MEAAVVALDGRRVGAVGAPRPMEVAAQGAEGVARPVRAPPFTVVARRTATAVRSGAGAAGMARVPR